MNEADLQARVLKRLRLWGGLWTKIWGGPYAKAGVADIVGCIDGKYVEIELKHPKYDDPKSGLTPTQWNRRAQVKANGGVAIVANNEEELFTQLENVKRNA